MSDRVLLALFVVPAMIVIAAWFRQRSRFRWLAVAAAVFVLMPWGLFMRGVNSALEWKYVQGVPQGPGDAIVLLTGAVQPPEPERPVPVVGGNTYERLFYAAWLHKNWRPLPILVCGGPDRDGSTPQTPFSHTVQRVLVNEGVPSAMVWTEDQSLTTYENALYGGQILRSKNIHRIVLVTEAYHMLRAELCFRKQGFDVVPAPCSFRSRFHWKAWHIFLPGREDFDYTFDGLHELTGLGWYLLRGRV